MIPARSHPPLPGVRMLALCYMLPPALFPQAIQIGRLLANSRHTAFRVSGPLGQSNVTASARSPRVQPDASAHLVVPDRAARWPHLHRLGLRLLPRYGSAPDEYRGWARRAVEAVLAAPAMTRFKPEVVVSFGEPMSDHLLGQDLAQRLSLPWIAHFSDPWADNPFRRAHKLSHGVNRTMETGVVTHADALIFTSEETRQLLGRFHGQRLLDKAKVLSHSFEPELYPARAPAVASNRLVVRYLGNFYGQRSPYPLLRAIELIKAKQPALLRQFRFELIGGMPGWMKLHPLIRRSDPDVVRFLPSVSYAQSLAAMVAADILLVIDAPASESVFLPSKLIDYLGARRPVFGIVPPGTSARVIGDMGGLTADPRDPQAIVEALTMIAKQSEDQRDGSVARAAEQVRTYEAPAVAAGFDAIVAEVAARRAARVAGART